MKLLGIFFLCLCLFSCKNESVTFTETFDYSDGEIPENFWSEGCRASIKNEQLYVNADTQNPQQSTVWLNKNLSGNISIEFDVHVIASQDTANNINCFFMYAHPDENLSLQSTTNKRADARYGLYHKLNGYIITYLANGNEEKARFRFRKNPGFNLLKEKFDYECRSGKTYHIKIIKNENNIQYWVDGIQIIDFFEENNHGLNEGFFAFRTWHTELWWDNLTIKTLN